jgi:D-lactate dehydrogenase
MKLTIFSSKADDEQFLREANRASGHDLIFIENRLTSGTAVLAQGSPVV